MSEDCFPLKKCGKFSIFKDFDFISPNVGAWISRNSKNVNARNGGFELCVFAKGGTEYELMVELRVLQGSAGIRVGKNNKETKLKEGEHKFSNKFKCERTRRITISLNACTNSCIEITKFLIRAIDNDCGGCGGDKCCSKFVCKVVTETSNLHLPKDVECISVTVIGGGGGGSATGGRGGGGGGSGYFLTESFNVDLGASLNITIGDGGLGGAGVGINGAQGGTTTVEAPSGTKQFKISTPGGNGGISSNGTGGDGGYGGGGSDGVFSVGGKSQFSFLDQGHSGSGGFGGLGGNNISSLVRLGGNGGGAQGGVGASTNAVAGNGLGYGDGGGGGYPTPSFFSGGNGANGVAIIKYWTKLCKI